MNGVPDPDLAVPGDAAAVEELSTRLRRTADLLGAVAERVAAIGARGSVWEGPVAHGFLDHVGDLTAGLHVLESRLRRAAEELAGWRLELEERRRQYAVLHEQLLAATAGRGAADDAGAGVEADRLRNQLLAVAEEHEAAGARLATRLRSDAEDITRAGAADPAAWLPRAEALLRELGERVGGWVAAQGPAFREAVGAVSDSTALGATAGQAAGSLDPALDHALGAAVAAVAAGAPASHRLVAAARRAQRPIPLESLPAATFAPQPTRAR